MANPRYTRQIRKRDCAGTAIVNFLKWTGEKVAYRKVYKGLSEMLATTEEDGTNLKNFKKVLKTLNDSKGYSFQFVEDPCFTDLKIHLNKRLPFFFCYKVNDGLHLAFVDQDTGVDFRFINHYDKKTMGHLCYTQVEKICEYECYAWLVVKK